MTSRMTRGTKTGGNKVERSQEEKPRIAEFYGDGQTQSFQEVSNHSGIPLGKVKTIIRIRTKIAASLGKRKRQRTAAYPGLGKEVLQFVKQAWSISLPVTGALIRAKEEQIFPQVQPIERFF